MEQLKRLNPISIFCYFFAVIFFTMFSVNPLFSALSFVFSVLLFSLLKGKLEVKRLAFSLLTVAAFTLINALFSHNGLTVLLYINDNPITLESIAAGALGGLLIVSSLYWFSSLNLLFTSDDVIYLFSRISPSFALTLSMTLRFFPLMKSRYKEICDCEGAIAPQKNKLKSLLNRLSILITWSLENGVDTADSMNARGYFQKPKRSIAFNPYRKIDAFAEILTAVLFITALIFHKGYSAFPVISIPETNLISLFSYITLLLLPIFFIVKEAILWRKFQSET